ncbi:MAG: tRNA pseudouridine(54/55) synthase Pus10 [Thermoproteota archaeon]
MVECPWELLKKLASKFVLCDGCFGRQFSLLAPRIDKWELGYSIKTALFLSALMQYERDGKRRALNLLKALARSGFDPAIFYLRDRYGVVIKVEPCYICGTDIRQALEKAVADVVERLKKMEVRTFKSGSSLSPSLMRREDEIKRALKIPWGESIKNFINNYMDHEVSRCLKISPEVEEPDVMFVVNPFNGDLNLTLFPLYLRGRYRKLERGISQTKKRGKDPLSSIEGMVASILVPEIGATDLKFHGAGREDVDALMLGNGRPFVLEVREPVRRSLDIKALERKINEAFQGKIEVLDLEYASKKDVQKVKMLGERINKAYEAIIKLGRDVSEEELNKLQEKIKGLQISQRTPSRVLWRRGDKIRRKTIFSAELSLIDKNTLRAILITQGGTYIKEFVSGDSGRTTPSLSELLNTTAECLELEVIDFLGDL